MSTVAVSKGFSTVIFGGLEELLIESRLELRHAKATKQRQKMDRPGEDHDGILIGWEFTVMYISLKDHGTRTLF